MLKVATGFGTGQTPLELEQRRDRFLAVYADTVCIGSKLFIEPERLYHAEDALKWGIVAVATGAALVLIQMLPYERDEPIVLGIALLFVGIGLLVYYALARKAGVEGAGGSVGSGGSGGHLGSGVSFEGVESRETVRETSKL